MGGTLRAVGQRANLFALAALVLLAPKVPSKLISSWSSLCEP